MLQSQLTFPDLHILLESAHPNLIGYQELMEQMVQKYKPSGYFVQHEQMLTGIETIRKLLRCQSQIETFSETLVIQILQRIEDLKRTIYSNLLFDSMPDEKLFQRYSCLELQMQNQLSLPQINSIDQYLDCAIKLQWGVADYYDKFCIEFDRAAQSLEQAFIIFQKVIQNVSGIQITTQNFARYQNTYQLSHLQFEPFEMVEIIASYPSTLELADIQQIYGKCSYLYELMQKYERYMTYWVFTITNYKFRRFESLYVDPTTFTKSFYPQMQFYYEKITYNNKCMSELSEELSLHLEQVKLQKSTSQYTKIAQDFLNQLTYDSFKDGLIADIETSQQTLVVFTQMFDKKELFIKEFQKYNEVYRILKWNFQQFEMKIISKNQNTKVKQAFQSMPLKRPYGQKKIFQEKTQDEYIKMQNQLKEILINQIKLISDMTRDSRKLITITTMLRLYKRYLIFAITTLMSIYKIDFLLFKYKLRIFNF
ncbi:hypothetical protein pb186bvf_019225 [Paramecium bursaria]